MLCRSTLIFSCFHQVGELEQQPNSLKVTDLIVSTKYLGALQMLLLLIALHWDFFQIPWQWLEKLRKCFLWRVMEKFREKLSRVYLKAWMRLGQKFLVLYWTIFRKRKPQVITTLDIMVTGISDTNITINITVGIVPRIMWLLKLRRRSILHRKLISLNFYNEPDH